MKKSGKKKKRKKEKGENEGDGGESEDDVLSDGVSLGVCLVLLS